MLGQIRCVPFFVHDYVSGETRDTSYASVMKKENAERFEIEYSVKRALETTWNNEKRHSGRR